MFDIDKNPRFSRRDFAKAAAFAAAIPAVPSFASEALGAGLLADAPVKSLKLLVLGGTGFIGPHIVNRAIERGHTVTLFNRGKTNTELFPDLEKLKGDRDPKKDDGLSALEGRDWDAVIDTSGYVPRIVGASANLLAEHSNQYVFISSVSAYANPADVGITEESELATMEDESVEDVKRHYGPLKVLCEKAAATAMSGRATIIRPGFIVGPRDPFPNRFTLWVMRVNRGGELLAPGTPKDPVQFIDARDLARFVIHSLEKKTTGDFNAVGPKDPMGVGEMIAGICKGVESDAKEVWINNEFLQANGGQGMHFIPWIPPGMGYDGFGAVSNAKSIKAGMTYTDVSKTALDTRDWFINQPEDKKKTLMGILDAPVEQNILKAWNDRDNDGN